jgi:hypothetical protein
LDDPVHHGIVREEGNYVHLTLAFGTDQRVDFINLTANLGPAPPWDLPRLLLDDDELAGSFL